MASGFQTFTGDAVLHSSGTAVIIYGINLVSGGSGGVVALRAGTDVTGTIVIQENGTAGQGKTVSYGENGIVFPTGCFVDIDANVSFVTISYQVV